MLTTKHILDRGRGGKPIRTKELAQEFGITRQYVSRLISNLVKERKLVAAKMESKNLDLIVTNDATEPGAGFSVDTNRVTMLRSDGVRVDLPLMTKSDVADSILDQVAELLDGR